MTKNEKAFLDMIAYSEIGEKLLQISDNGYNVIVGSTPSKPILMSSYKDHPRKVIKINTTLYSSAAGRYQLLARYWDYYKTFLQLKDYSPASQDAVALQQIKERKALDDINAGRFEEAVNKVSNIWASLPNSQYGQHTNDMGDLKTAYIEAGGTVA